MSRLLKQVINRPHINCENPYFLGSGAQGSVIKCGHNKKEYAVKYAELDENKDPQLDQTYLICPIKNELKIGLYLNSSQFNNDEPILFSKKYGRENIVKYYKKKVSNLSDEQLKIISSQKAKAENISRIQLGQESKCYIVSEICNEGGLNEFLNKPDNFEKFVLNYTNFENMIYQIFSGLVYFYNKGLYHWDLKPANIFVKSIDDSKSGEKKYIFKLGDYGMVTNYNNVRNKLNNLVAKGVIKNVSDKPDIQSQDYESTKQFSKFDERLFSGTWIYIPDNHFRITTYYRDLYAFVLSIYVILNECKNANNPNKIYNDNMYLQKKKEKGPRFGSEINLSLEELLSTNYDADTNFIYKYYIENRESPMALHSKLLYDIANIIMLAGKQIISSPLTKHEYYQEQSTKLNNYTPRSIILETDNNIFASTYKKINNLFEHNRSILSNSSFETPISNYSKNTFANNTKKLQISHGKSQNTTKKIRTIRTSIV